MRQLCVRAAAEVLAGSQVVAAMSESDAARLSISGPAYDRFYLSWDMVMNPQRYCLQPEHVAHESAWTVVSADSDGKWVELHLVLPVLLPDGSVHLASWQGAERAATRVQVIEPPRAS